MLYICLRVRELQDIHALAFFNRAILNLISALLYRVLYLREDVDALGRVDVVDDNLIDVLVFIGLKVRGIQLACGLVVLPHRTKHLRWLFQLLAIQIKLKGFAVLYLVSVIVRV